VLCSGGFGVEFEPEVTFSLNVRMGEPRAGMDALGVEKNLFPYRY